MTTIKTIATVMASALIGAFAGYGWGQYRQTSLGQVGIAPTPGAMDAATSERKVSYWHDPMKPEVKFDKPGKSPFMDMQLVPVYADDSPAAGGVTVSTTAQQNLGVRLGRVERRSLAQSLTAVGSVAYDEQGAAVVQARVSGFVSSLIAKATLNRVRRGDPLAEIVAPEWIEAESEYLTLFMASSSDTTALRNAARARMLVLGIPEAAVARLERTRTVPNATPLYAPIDGVIAELGVREGAAFSPNALLFRINALSSVWVNAQVPEASVQHIVPRMLVETRSIDWPGQVFVGRVVALLPQVDTMTRTRTVRVEVNNRDGRLTPGMFVQTTFQDRARAPQLWVPSEAVIVTGTRSVVIAKLPTGSFTAVDVIVGGEANGATAILSGLSEGDSVVVSGQFLIDSEASLKSTLTRLSATDANKKDVAP